MKWKTVFCTHHNSMAPNLQVFQQTPAVHTRHIWGVRVYSTSATVSHKQIDLIREKSNGLSEKRVISNAS